MVVYNDGVQLIGTGVWTFCASNCNKQGYISMPPGLLIHERPDMSMLMLDPWVIRVIRFDPRL